MIKVQYREEDGIAAIKYMQALADVPETDEQARAGWRAMTMHQQDITMAVYKKLIKEEDPKAAAQAAIAGNPEAQQRLKNDLERPAQPRKVSRGKTKKG